MFVTPWYAFAPVRSDDLTPASIPPGIGLPLVSRDVNVHDA